MNAKDFARRLDQISPLTEREIEERMRPLRDSILPRGGRGPHAPEIDYDHAAAMLLQLVPRRAVEADVQWLPRMDVMALVRPPGRDRIFGRPFPAELKLTETMIFLLQNPALSWQHLTIACDGQSARLRAMEEGATIVDYLFTARPDWKNEAARSQQAYDGIASGLLSYSFTFGAGAVKSLAKALAAE